MSPALRRSFQIAALTAAMGLAVCSTVTAVKAPLFRSRTKISHRMHR